MPRSFLARHRTICATLYDIQKRANSTKCDDPVILELVQEALLYARRMSIKLVEYKNRQERRKARVEATRKFPIVFVFGDEKFILERDDEAKMTKEEIRVGLLEGRLLVQEEWADTAEIVAVNELVDEGVTRATDWEYQSGFQCEVRMISAVLPQPAAVVK